MQPAFFSSSSFRGLRFGYEFKLGTEGLGYYLTRETEKKSVVNPLNAKASKNGGEKKRKLAAVWAEGAMDNKKALEKQGAGGREGNSIEAR
jgi:hypothetical protein